MVLKPLLKTLLFNRRSKKKKLILIRDLLQDDDIMLIKLFLFIQEHLKLSTTDQRQMDIVTIKKLSMEAERVAKIKLDHEKAKSSRSRERSVNRKRR